MGKTPAVGGIWTNILGTAGTLNVASGSVSILATGVDGASPFATAQSAQIFAGFDLTMTTFGAYSDALDSHE